MNGVMKKMERVVEEMEISSPPPAPQPAGDKGVRILKILGGGNGEDINCG